MHTLLHIYKPWQMDMMVNHNYFIAVLILIFFSLSLPSKASIQQENAALEQHNQQRHFSQIPYDDIESGSLFYKTKQGYQAQLAQHSDFSVEVNGLVSRVKVKQTFVNRSNEWLEAVYVFPLSENSAVDQMKMIIGERIVLGEIKKKKQAKKLYQQAKKQGKKASLVSQQRPNMFTTKVANIGPNEKVTIEIGYLEQVHYQNQSFSLRLPLTITPRFVAKQSQKAQGLKTEEQPEDNEHQTRKDRQAISDNTAITFDALHNNGWAVADADEISPPQQYYSTLTHKNGQRPTQSATISATISLGLVIDNLSSLYHPIHQRRSHQSIELNLQQKHIRLDQDFVLTWQTANNQQPQAAFFKTSQPDADYGLLMLVPPKAKLINALPKEVVVIIDTSGSMAGVSIRQAKRALGYALNKLNPDDSFNVIAFNDQPSAMFSHSQLANRENIRWAQQWLHTLSAGGGTRMYSALELALKPSKPENEMRNSYKQVIFITDGAVGDEANLLTLIEKQLKQTRLHTVGIGSAPNSYFMSEAAQLGRGSFRYIGKVNEVHQQINQLFDDINQPVLTDLRVSFPAKNSQQMIEYYPKKIPDLYASQPLKLTVKLPKNSGDYILVQGILNQQPWRQKVNISQAKQQSGIATLWARDKIDSLSHQLRRNAGEPTGKSNEEIIDEITQLALSHQLVSRYTSFIAIEQKISRANNKKLNSAKVANAMPKGSKQIAVANTALGLEGFIRFGLVMLICALFMHVFCFWWKR